MRTDLTGTRFGRLTVVEPTDQRKNGYTVWRCRCDCGGEIHVDVRKLRRGTALDCGCAAPQVRHDLTGQRFGRLTVLGKAEQGKGAGFYWHCQCDCGGTIDVPARQLLRGYRRSCGCLSHPPLKEYVGWQFDDLTVLSYAGKRKGSHYWHCRCVCGRELDVRQSNLQSGHTSGCGCKAGIQNNVHFICGTSPERIRSTALSEANTSGVRGVYWNERRQMWSAQITFQGETRYLGSYSTLEEAAQRRRQAEDEVFRPFLEWFDETAPVIASEEDVKYTEE